MPGADRHARVWMGKLDALAETANKNLGTAYALWDDPQRKPGDAAEGALMAIASHLAYGNAVAAASFYMANRLWITPDQEAS